MDASPPEPSIDLGGFVQTHEKQPVGPLVGTIIIVVLLLAGALYFWGARLNKQAAQNQVPYIPAGTTTVQQVSP